MVENLTFLSVSSQSQSSIRGGRRVKKRRSLLVTPSLRHRSQINLRGQDLSSECSQSSSKDTVAYAILGEFPIRWNSEYFPGKLVAGDEWQWRLLLVLSLDLEVVEEVDGGCVDFDEVFVSMGL